MRNHDYISRFGTHHTDSASAHDNTLARLDGDEFVLVVSDLSDANGAIGLTQRLMDMVALPFMIEEQEIYITTSVGISLYPLDNHDPEELLQQAHMALHYAKDRGRNCYQFYAKELNARTRQYLELKSELHKALEQDQLELYYQPRIDVTSGQMTCAEALVRWQHPKRGLIMPSEFIALAEDSGLITALGEWILHHASVQTRLWQEQERPPLVTAVNISVNQLNADFPRQLETILKENPSRRTISRAGTDRKHFDVQY